MRRGGRSGNAGCSRGRQRLGALGLATSLLTGCVTGVFEPRIATVCPPVIEYSRRFQARAAEELALLPKGSAISELLSDYVMMREQARACPEKPGQCPVTADLRNAACPF